MKYEKFENSSTDKIWNMDGYVYGPKTIKGAYSALCKKIEKIIGQNLAESVFGKSDMEKVSYEWFCKSEYANYASDNKETGESIKSIYREDRLYVFYKHPQYEYWHRMNIELLDEETNFWYIDFGMSKEA